MNCYRDPYVRPFTKSVHKYNPNPEQLLMVVHFKPHCNTYGSLAAYIVALLVRLSGGEPLLGLPAAIHYPGYDADEDRQLFPFRTMAMVLSLLTLIGVSWWTKWAFETGRLAPHHDYFRCVVNIPEDAIRVEEPAENGEQVCACVCVVTGHQHIIQMLRAHVCDRSYP